MSEIQKYNSNQQLKSDVYLTSLIGAVDDSIKEEITAKQFESALFQSIADKEVPEEMLKTRIGGGGEELVYFPETYTISELNRLFPGWWTEEMKTVYIPEVRCFMTTGLLCIDYFVPPAKHIVRKMYGVGASYVQSKKDDPTIPMQPDDQAKASLTEWLKIAGKRYGIGLDIYSQIIPDRMKAEFEDLIRMWTGYDAQIIAVAGTITKPQAFKNFLSEIPSIEQTTKFVSILEGLNAGVKHNLWVNFTKLKRSLADQWLSKTEDAINKSKQNHQNQNGGQ